MIKERIDELRKQQETIASEIESLQQQCTHPEFVRGLTMIACVQEIDICTTCGWGKPIDFSGDEFGVITNM